MTDPYLNDQFNRLMKAIEDHDDDQARRVAKHLSAEGFEGLGQDGPGYVLAAAFTRAALSARSKGRPGEAEHLIERRDRLCTPEQIEDATLNVIFELGVRAGWLPASDYDRVDVYLQGLTGRAVERWAKVQRRED